MTTFAVPESCGELAQLCVRQDGTVRWNTAVILALEVASGRSGAGEPVARWSQNSRESGFFSLCSVPGEKATSE